MKRLFIFLYIFLLMNVGEMSAADGLSLQGSVDKHRATIGDRVRYTITLFHPADVAVTPPEKTAALGPWEVKDLQAAEQPDRTGTRLVYTLTTFTTGEVLIPGIALKYTDATKAVKEIRTDPQKVTIDSVLDRNAAGGIRDIQPPVDIPLPWYVYLFWLLGIAAAVALGIGAYTRYKKRSLREILQPPAPPIPPHVRALQELEKLRGSGLLADGRIKEYYVALFDIARTYLGAVYFIETMDRTSGEIYAQLRQLEKDRLRLATVREFFDACDLVKFAKYRPDEPACLKDWETAKRIVEQCEQR